MNDILRQVKEEILFVSVTHEQLAKDEEGLFKTAIENKKIAVTVRVLDPDSTHVNEQQMVFRNDSIKEIIVKALDELQKTRSRLRENYRDKLIIQSFDADIRHSIIVADPNTENAWIKVENHPRGSSHHSRQSVLVFRKDNSSFYEDCLREFNEISQNLKTY